MHRFRAIGPRALEDITTNGSRKPPYAVMNRNRKTAITVGVRSCSMTAKKTSVLSVLLTWVVLSSLLGIESRVHAWFRKKLNGEI